MEKLTTAQKLGAAPTRNVTIRFSKELLELAHKDSVNFSKLTRTALGYYLDNHPQEKAKWGL